HINTQFSVMKGAAYLQDAVPRVKVLPHEPADLAPPQARGQLHVEEVTPYPVFPHGVQKGVQFPVGQDMLRRMVCLRHRRAHGRVLGDDMRVEGILHRLMEDGVEAVDGGVRQSGTKPRMLLDPAVLFQSAIEFLHILRCHQRHLLAAELRLDVVFDTASIPREGAGADGVLFIVRQPAVQPLPQGHAAVLGQFHVLIAFDILMELFRQFFLCMRIGVLEDGRTVFLVAHHDTAFPAAVLPLAHHAVAGWSSFCHLVLLFRRMADAFFFLPFEGVEPICLQLFRHAPRQLE
ncbi:ParB/Sulfiredoxin domain-containing protein, partial [Dysosmobacter welbionis]